jgi:hypothetical protein
MMFISNKRVRIWTFSLSFPFLSLHSTHFCVLYCHATHSHDNPPSETLIVWTEPDGVDYALSFQEPEGCLEVWNFIQDVQQHLRGAGN